MIGLVFRSQPFYSVQGAGATYLVEIGREVIA